MSEPVQQHYLLKAPYLKFFEVPQRPGFVWMYQRHQDPVLVSIEKAAKERHLYSFATADGALSIEMEAHLQRIEDAARAILGRHQRARRREHLERQGSQDVRLQLYFA